MTSYGVNNNSNWLHPPTIHQIAVGACL
uniref:Uncharacterized protein n=1 Tax=Anguilla anguilla TaxID=7936 RepID=A0A0E9SC70_ANGAN